MTGESLAMVTHAYPTTAQPGAGAFVAQLAAGLTRAGAHTVIIAPRALLRDPGGDSLGPEDVPVLRPAFASFSNRTLGRFSTFRLTIASFARAAARAATTLSGAPRYTYGHFLYPAGFAAAVLGHIFRAPAVVALGESNLAYYEQHLALDRIRRDVARLAGFVCLSRQNLDYCIGRLGVPEDRAILVPNAVDLTRFYPRDRQETRHRLGLPTDRPIVIFVGHLNERKGPLRVLAALERLPDVAVIFLGSGKQVPRGPQVLRAAPVPHREVPEWLCAADVFVLPTLAEGSPNAVIEAAACGLPIVSSDLPFIREILDDGSAVLVRPEDVDAIAAALSTLLADPQRRRRIGEAATRRARQFTIEDRARLLLGWLRGLSADPPQGKAGSGDRHG